MVPALRASRVLWVGMGSARRALSQAASSRKSGDDVDDVEEEQEEVTSKAWSRPVLGRGQGGAAAWTDAVAKEQTFVTLSDEEVKLAMDLAKQKGIQLPEQILSSISACRNFVNAVRGDTQYGNNSWGGRPQQQPSADDPPPSEKQIWLAHKIQGTAGVEIPPGAFVSKVAMSNFISAHVTKIPASSEASKAQRQAKPRKQADAGASQVKGAGAAAVEIGLHAAPSASTTTMEHSVQHVHRQVAEAPPGEPSAQRTNNAGAAAGDAQMYWSVADIQKKTIEQMKEKITQLDLWPDDCGNIKNLRSTYINLLVSFKDGVRDSAREKKLTPACLFKMTKADLAGFCKENKLVKAGETVVVRELLDRILSFNESLKEPGASSVKSDAGRGNTSGDAEGLLEVSAGIEVGAAAPRTLEAVEDMIKGSPGRTVKGTVTGIGTRTGTVKVTGTGTGTGTVDEVILEQAAAARKSSESNHTSYGAGRDAGAVESKGSVGERRAKMIKKLSQTQEKLRAKYEVLSKTTTGPRALLVQSLHDKLNRIKRRADEGDRATDPAGILKPLEEGQVAQNKLKAKGRKKPVSKRGKQAVEKQAHSKLNMHSKILAQEMKMVGVDDQETFKQGIAKRLSAGGEASGDKEG